MLWNMWGRAIGNRGHFDQGPFKSGDSEQLIEVKESRLSPCLCGTRDMDSLVAIVTERCIYSFIQ